MNRNLITSAVAVLVTVFLLSTSGCGSIRARTGYHVEPYPYMGVTDDLDMIRGPHQCFDPLLFVAVGVIDLPFSFVVDTVLLPVDLIHAMKEEK